MSTKIDLGLGKALRTFGEVWGSLIGGTIRILTEEPGAWRECVVLARQLRAYLDALSTELERLEAAVEEAAAGGAPAARITIEGDN
jgi:hypothetical protein